MMYLIILTIKNSINSITYYLVLSIILFIFPSEIKPKEASTIKERKNINIPMTILTYETLRRNIFFIKLSSVFAAHNYLSPRV